MTNSNSMLFNTMKFHFTGDGTAPYKIDLDAINQSVSGIDASLNATLTKQNQVNTLLDEEITRLDEKDTQIEQAQAGQKRVLMLNESYRMRQAEYTKLIIASAFVFAIVILIKYLRTSFTILPDAIYSLIHILMFSALIIYAMVIYINVSSREKTNFNRLDIPTPDVVKSTADKRRKSREDDGNLMGISDSELCRGAACCDDNTQTFNDVSGNCVSNES